MITKAGIPERMGAQASTESDARAGTETWLLVGIGVWLVAGLFIDAWAHYHRRPDLNLLSSADLTRAFTPPALPSTISPWHLPFLLGMLAAAAVIIGRTWAARAPGRSWRQTLPEHLRWPALGLALWVVGWAADLIWPPAYTRSPVPGVLRFEALVGLFSPAQVLQAVGIGLVLSAPLRAAPRGPAGRWLPVIALTLLLSLLSWLTQFMHPLVDPWAEAALQRRGWQNYRPGSQFYFGESLGIASILLQAALLVGVALPWVRRGRLPVGSFTLMWTANAALMSLLQNRYLFIASAAVAGAVADVFLKQLSRPPRPGDLRLFAAALPVIYFTCYFLVLQFLSPIAGLWGMTAQGLASIGAEGLGWSMRLWLGVTLAAGLVGWLLGALVQGPDEPAALRSGGQ